MFKPVTIKDIALELSISPSTVSRALRNSHEVSAEKKRLVCEYAAKVNYHSNPNALSLKNKRSYSIGVMVADVANSFFSQTINGIESIAYKKGYHIIISQSHDSNELEVLSVKNLANRSVDGLLISMAAQTTDYSHIQQLHDQGLPIVFFDRILDAIPTYKITTDNVKAAQHATDILITKGFKRIAHIANAPQLSITIDRLNGYKTALQNHNLPIDDELVKYCYAGGRNLEEIEQVMKDLLSLTPMPDAILITSDKITTGVMRAINKLRPINDIPIIGFSNSDVIDLLSPKISYVRQKAFEMGEIAIEMLIKMIESKYPIYEFETRLLDAEFFLDNLKK